MRALTFAYYCSGHGYGHGTRVSAVASYLRQLDEAPKICIVSSAPKHVFELALSCGARYRHADIDPVIVQPLAYYVDRGKSVDALKSFLSKLDKRVAEEVHWLTHNAVDCVLSDAAFLACKAANAANIPSVLITNFTFDSVYSYLSIRFPDNSPLNPTPRMAGDLGPRVSLLRDEPIPPKEIEHLVKELHDGYRCAELLLRLPGNVPIPSFGIHPSLPSFLWTDPESNTFIPEVALSLLNTTSSADLHQSIPFPQTRRTLKCKPLPRMVIQAPLVVRHPSPDAYTSAGRKRILGSIGVPGHFQTAPTKVLIVSFGGQIFRQPHSLTVSRSESPSGSGGSTNISQTPSSESVASNCNTNGVHPRSHAFVHVVPPIATESQLWIPGAPPANKTPTTTTDVPQFPPYDHSLNVIDEPPGAPGPNRITPDFEPPSPGHRFLPDDSWIAIVCAAPTIGTIADDEELPANFFLAPKDAYIPDLTALADVLLGKLGYGTTAECVDACTPFVYVPRPLFVEEHGLRRLLQDEGVGVELSREKYEDGDWAGAVQTAWLAGREAKERKRAIGDDGTRKKQGMEMAGELVEWVRDWKAAEALHGGSEVANANGKLNGQRT